MKIRTAVVIGTVMLASVGIVALVHASCSPQPYCEYMTCIYDDDVCLYPLQECPTNYTKVARTEYAKYLCLGIGDVYEVTGWVCVCFSPPE